MERNLRIIYELRGKLYGKKEDWIEEDVWIGKWILYVCKMEDIRKGWVVFEIYLI